MKRKETIGLSQRIDLQGLPWGFGEDVDLDPCPGFILCDMFTDDDAVLLVNHAPDKDPIGLGWQIGLSGTWRILGNQAYQSAGLGAANTVFIDTGISDYTVDCVVFTGTAPALGLIFRAKDGDDNLEVMLDPGGNLVRVFKNVGGARTHLNSVAMAIGPNTTYDMRVVLNGTSIKVYVDNVLRNDFNDATHQTETGVGFWTWNANNTVRWDDLTVQI